MFPLWLDHQTLCWLFALVILALAVAALVLGEQLRVRSVRGRRPGLERVRRRGPWFWRAAA